MCEKCLGEYKTKTLGDSDFGQWKNKESREKSEYQKAFITKKFVVIIYTHLKKEKTSWPFIFLGVYIS